MKSAIFEGFRGSPKQTLKELVADAVRSAIVSGEFKPGQQLFQEKIASVLSVSIIPVREALFALREEGFVEYFPNRGSFVSRIESSDIKEVYEIRFFLESGALSLSIPNLTDLDFAEAERLANLCDNATNVHDKRQWDLQFHSSLYQPCGRQRLLALIGQIHNQVARYMNMCIYFMGFKSHPEYNHQQILSLCKERKTAQAIEVLEKHLEVAKEMLCAGFESG